MVAVERALRRRGVGDNDDNGDDDDVDLLRLSWEGLSFEARAAVLAAAREGTGLVDARRRTGASERAGGSSQMLVMHSAEKKNDYLSRPLSFFLPSLLKILQKKEFFQLP